MHFGFVRHNGEGPAKVADLLHWSGGVVAIPLSRRHPRFAGLSARHDGVIGFEHLTGISPATGVDSRPDVLDARVMPGYAVAICVTAPIAAKRIEQEERAA